MKYKFLIALLIGGIEWMFLGMFFFLDWHPLIKIGTLAFLGLLGFFIFNSAIKDYDKQGQTQKGEIKND